MSVLAEITIGLPTGQGLAIWAIVIAVPLPILRFVVRAIGGTGDEIAFALIVRPVGRMIARLWR